MTGLRLAGAAAVTLCGGYGGYLRYDEAREASLLSGELITAVEMIKNELQTYCCALDEMFRHLGENGPRRLRGSFGYAAAQSDMCAALEERFLSLPFGGEAMEVVRTLCATLGRYDAQSQLRTLDMLSWRLKTIHSEEKARCSRAFGTCVGVGLSAGAMAAVLLV